MEEESGACDMTIKIDRYKAGRLLMACSFCAESLQNEAEDAETTEDRAQIARRSVNMWREIHDEIKQQIDKWDKASGR